LAGVGGLALAGVAAVAIALGSGLGGGDVQPQPATAAQLLREAAVGAAQQPYVPLRAGQYWYTKTVGEQHFSTAHADGRGPYPGITLPVTTEEWAAASGWGRTRSVTGTRGRFPSARAERDWLASGRRWAGEVTDMRVAPQRQPLGESLDDFGQLSPRALRALPTDPQRLYELIAAASRRSAEGTVAPATVAATMSWERAVGLLGQQQAPTPPALRAATYRVLARIPGVELRGRSTDTLGRPGTVVAQTLRGFRSELVVDPATGTLLEQRTVLLRDQFLLTEEFRPVRETRVPAGWRTRTTYVASGIVDSKRARP
ncbi:CU044_5270 family protein, partial [Conexibacter stalactiti]